MRRLLCAITLLALVGCPDETPEVVAPITNDVMGGGSAGDTTTTTGGDTDHGDGDATTGGVTGMEEVVEPPKPPCDPTKSCDDEDPCTINDKCSQGVCAGDPYTCDDGRECTLNDCDSKGGCQYPVDEGSCLINNVCLGQGTLNPQNQCERCDSDEAKTSWTEREELDPCEDGNPCTFGDYCKKGECRKGIKATCDDDNECTKDTCDTFVGCKNEPTSGTCDDGNPCTPDSVCSGGVCQPVVEDCDDGNPCTSDTCLPALGCEHVSLEGPCEDGDACTTGDLCGQDGCVPGGPTDCGDGNACTVDECDTDFGCYATLAPDPCCSGAVHVCEDGDACTTDGCSPDGGCSHALNDGPCDDGDQCTAGDQCAAGVCESGSQAACDDKNPCTNDLCDPAGGCQYTPKFGDCNDGIACTTGDECLNGQCKGDASECKCEVEVGGPSAKANSLLLSTVAEAGAGVDVDQNPATCSPEGSCSGGVDNELMPLAGFVNSNLESEVQKGGLNLLMTLVDPKTDGSEFTLVIYAGKLTNGSCSHLTTACNYLVDAATLNDDCSPLITIDNARIVGGKLTAGGPGTNFPLQIPLFGSTYLEVNLFSGVIQGDIELAPDKVVSISNGRIGGAIPKSIFISAIEFVPEDQLPVPKESIAQLLDLLVQHDIDTNNDGAPDAASIGLTFTAVGAILVGVD